MVMQLMAVEWIEGDFFSGEKGNFIGQSSGFFCRNFGFWFLT